MCGCIYIDTLKESPTGPLIVIVELNIVRLNIVNLIMDELKLPYVLETRTYQSKRRNTRITVFNVEICNIQVVEFKC